MSAMPETPERTRILVVDDEDVVCRSCARILAAEQHQVDTTQSPSEGLQMAERDPYDVVIVDLKMPGLGGMEFLRRIKESCPQTEVIMMTGYAQIETAVQAMKLGAYDYIPKPFSPDQLAITVGKLLERRELFSENAYLRRELQSKYRFENIVGGSRPMQEVYEIIERVAPTNGTVLIRGESGTGKELIARAIHFNSPRRDARFVPVDCGSLSETLLESELFGHVKGAFTGAVATKKGLFEMAHGGTLFLDEIGNTSLHVQTRLLRVLQEREFLPVGSTEVRKADIRLIAATNRDLERSVASGGFREELFYRLNIVPIQVPPLRDRREDIPALALHFLRKFAKEDSLPAEGFSTEALGLLVNYDWPGNVRQLENVIHRAVVLLNGRTLEEKHLPPEVRGGSVRLPVSVPRTNDELKECKKKIRESSVEEVERLFVIEALRRNQWNVTRAAAEVGMHRPNLQAMMRKYNIRAGNGREQPESSQT